MHTNNEQIRRLKKGLNGITEREYETVHTNAIKMIHTNINDAVPYCLLGLIASDHGNHIKSDDLLKRAIALDSTCVYYHAYSARILTTLGQQNQAKYAADQAAGLPLNDPSIADMIGVVYARIGFHEKAVAFFNKAVALDNKPANYHYNLAAAQQFLGRFEHAKIAYRDTISRDENHHRAWSSLISLEKQSKDANHLETLFTLFDCHSDDENARLHFGHAIAKTLEDVGQHEDSFNWLLKAKQAKRDATKVKQFDYPALFAAAKCSAPPKTPPSIEANQSMPIFIFGLPRTGTTLVDRILSSHAHVTSAGELNMFASLVKTATHTKSNLVMDAETLAHASQMNMDEIGHEYIANTRDLVRKSKYMTDKMPLNFFYAGLIHRAFPNARMIVLRRGAMDSCLSNYRQLFTVQYSYYNYTYDLQDTADFYKRFDDLMNHWRQTLPANRFMEVHYEDIVFDQKNQTRRLLNFCDLPWDANCLDFHKNTAPVSTASSVQVRQPLYSGSIGRWKKYGNKLDNLQTALGDLAN